jgi:hypothetical protein
LRLGISFEGIFVFLVEIGFLVEVDPTEDRPPERYEYDRKYTREGVEEVSWIDGVHGPLLYSKNFMGGDDSTMTGYDLCAVLRGWLRTNSHAGRSVCEVVLEDPRFEAVRAHVSNATIFYSHIQSEKPLTTFEQMNQTRERLTAQLPCAERQYWWLDYFSLRQCVNDFQTTQVVALVKQIGTTIAEIDFDFNYLRRSFCILELYATLVGGGRLVCKTTPSFTVNFAGRSVDAAEASTRRPADKALIDSFIETEIAGGFEEFNRVVTAAAMSSAKKTWG